MFYNSHTAKKTFGQVNSDKTNRKTRIYIWEEKCFYQTVKGQIDVTLQKGCINFGEELDTNFNLEH